MATLYYVVYPAALGTPPTVAEVKAGQRPGGTAAVAAGSETATVTSGTGTQTWASLASGLTAGQDYKIAFVWSDTGADSGVVVGAFSTMASGVAPVVAATRADFDSGNQTGHTIALPTGITAGHLLVAVVTMSGTGTVSINTGVSGSNWSIIGNTISATSRSLIIAKVAEGSDALQLTTSTSRKCSYISIRVTGHGGLPTAASATATSAAPNPPSVSTGSEKNRLWIAARSATDEYGASAPSGYGGAVASYSETANITSTHLWSRTSTGSSEDPGTCPAGGDPSIDWVAWTIYVDPVVVSSATAGQTVPAPAQAAAGALVIGASAGQTVPAPAQAATGATVSGGAASQSVPAPTQAATGAARVAAAGSQSVPAPAQTAATGALASATGVQTVPAPEQTAAGAAIVSASADQSVPAPGQIATADTIDAGVVAATANQSVPAPTQSATGAALSGAFADHAVPAPTQAATGAVWASVAASQAVPAPAQAATGVVVEAGVATATANQSVPAPTQAATSVARVDASASQSVPAPTQDATGTVFSAGVSQALASQAVPAPSQLAQAQAVIGAVAAQVVQVAATIADMAARVAAGATQAVPAPVQQATGDGGVAAVPTFFEYAVPADGLGWRVQAEATDLEVSS